MRTNNRPYVVILYPKDTSIAPISRAGVIKHTFLTDVSGNEILKLTYFIGLYDTYPMASYKCIQVTY